jgi:ribosomal protein L14
MVMATVKKGKPELRKKVFPAVVIRQRKAWRRKDGVYIYFEDNGGVIVNNKGEMKGECALCHSRANELARPQPCWSCLQSAGAWPVSAAQRRSDQVVVSQR